MHLSEFIKPEAVFFCFDGCDKDTVLDEMIGAICRIEGNAVAGVLHEAVFEREADRSTGIGRGLAVPHCRSHCLKHFYVSVAVLKEGIDWGALDERPVNFIFLVAGPSGRPERYLQLLSQISRLIRLPDATKRLLAATTPEQVLSVIRKL